MRSGRFLACFFLLEHLSSRCLHCTHHVIHLTTMFSVSATSCTVSVTGTAIVSHHMVAEFQRQTHLRKMSCFKQQICEIRLRFGIKLYWCLNGRIYLSALTSQERSQRSLKTQTHGLSLSIIEPPLLAELVLYT